MSAADTQFHEDMHDIYREVKRHLGAKGTPEQIRYVFEKQVERRGLAVPPAHLQLVAEKA